MRDGTRHLFLVDIIDADVLTIVHDQVFGAGIRVADGVIARPVGAEGNAGDGIRTWGCGYRIDHGQLARGILSDEHDIPGRVSAIPGGCEQEWRIDKRYREDCANDATDC